MLEAALQSGELEDAVKSVLKEIDAVLKSAETSRKESISPEVKREFEKVGRELRDLENRILELRDRERSLEKIRKLFTPFSKKFWRKCRRPATR
jgi:uncharacterized coiled-coil DUF342 family protein